MSSASSSTDDDGLGSHTVPRIAEGSRQLITVDNNVIRSPSHLRTTYREARSGVSLTRTNLPLFIDKGVDRDYSKEKTEGNLKKNEECTWLDENNRGTWLGSRGNVRIFDTEDLRK